MYEESTYLYKTNCEACGSSDANAIYSGGSSHCFSCGVTLRGSSNDTELHMEPVTMKEFNPSFIEYPNSIRGINERTLRLFTYGINNSQHVTYYYDSMGQITAEKSRGREKTFSWAGEPKSSTLFGQNIWKPNKKLSITITEGEIDAMSVSQVQQNKYPVVSVPNGAAAAKSMSIDYIFVAKAR